MSSSTAVTCILWPAGASTPRTEVSEVAAHYKNIDVSASDFNDNASWEVSPLSVRIGFAVKIKVITTGPNATTENIRPPLLFMAAETLTTSRSIKGDVILARCDGKPLHYFHAWFLLEQLDAVRIQGRAAFGRAEFNGGAHALHHAREALDGMWTPQFFAGTYETAKEELLMKSPQADASLGNPFQNNSPVCGGCGAASGPEGAALLKCARCLSVWYCSKECQKDSWKTHKPACTKTMKVNETVAKMQAAVKK